ncbi:helix-turn-helix domain-containing protein [Maribacter sp. MJ134]
MVAEGSGQCVGVHPSNYSKMEKGERDVSIEVADKLAKYFGGQY